MKAAVIVISVAALILLLCMSRLHFSFESTDGTTLSLRFLFVKISLYPKKQKKIRIRDYSLKKVKKRVRKAGEKKRSDKGKPTSKKEEKEGNDNKSDIKTFIIACLKTVVRDFSRRVRTERLTLHITVSGKDAAEAALKFSAANQFASLLCTIIDEKLPMKNTNKRSIIIVPNYIGEKDEYKVKVTLSIAVGSIFISAVKILISYVSSVKPNE